MIRIAATVALALLAAGVAQAQHDHASVTSAAGPPLYGNLGRWTHAVATSSPLAQKYFDQGLALSYGFNHAEAARAFSEAARLDPGCVMAWWGLALVQGPHINNPAMDEVQVRTAWEAIGIAKAKSATLPPEDPARVYVEAPAARYTPDPQANRAALDSAYAVAMRAVAHRFPDDADAQVLFAEAMMDLSPWNQWTQDGRMTPGTDEVIATLETVLKRWPDHPGANHLYVHAIEASPDPAKALASAKRLETLVPGAGHLVHMPSHIYARVERYDDARRVNERAVAVDEAYIAREKPQGMYPMMYTNHNVHFIWFASTMQGRSAEAIAAAKKLRRNVPDAMARQMSMVEFWPGVYYATLARFGRWDELLALPAPAADLRGQRYAWHHARGMAFAAKGDFGAADAELDSVRVHAATTPLDAYLSINPAAMVERVGMHALAGTIAMRQKDHDEALTELKLAVATEDSLHYDEPPTWYYPVRQSLGAALLAAGKPAEAEAVYREDLARHPGNGWSLFGLAQALEAQGRAQDAAAARAKFKRAWAGADVRLTASVF